MTSSSLNVLAAIAVFCSLFVCLFRTQIAKGMQLLDSPDAMRKLHQNAVPMVAGLAAFPAVALACVEAVSLGANDDGIAIFFSVVSGFFMIGYADDRLHVRPSRRLLLSLALFGALILMSPNLMTPYFKFGEFTANLGGGTVAFLAIIGASGAINAINMADGQNGLCSGLLLLWLGFLWATLEPGLSNGALIVAAAIAVALVFNLMSLVFLGDSGAYGLGSFVLGLMLFGTSTGHIDHGQIVAVLTVPVTDCVWLMLERRRRGHSPYDSDRQHLHHILEKALGTWLSLGAYLGLAGLGVAGALAGGWACVGAIAVQFAVVAVARLWMPRVPEMGLDRRAQPPAEEAPNPAE